METLFFTDAAINWATDRSCQSKILRWKVTQLNLPRQGSVNNPQRTTAIIRRDLDSAERTGTSCCDKDRKGSPLTSHDIT